MSDFVLISDPRVINWPILDNGDRLVDAARHPAITVSAKRASRNPWHRFLRSMVLERLAIAAGLLPTGVRLCLEEGYRPLAQQRLLFDAYLRELRAQLGPLPEEHLMDEATKYVARPDGSPPHSTGGALDVTLRSAEGEELDMGSTSDDTPLGNGGLNYTHSRAVGGTARRNRALLADVMTVAGFVNYPAEWWHWSYGDQYWAFRGQRRHAIYGEVPAAGHRLSLAPEGTDTVEPSP